MINDNVENNDRLKNENEIICENKVNENNYSNCGKMSGKTKNMKRKIKAEANLVTRDVQYANILKENMELRKMIQELKEEIGKLSDNASRSDASDDMEKTNKKQRQELQEPETTASGLLAAETMEAENENDTGEFVRVIRRKNQTKTANEKPTSTKNAEKTVSVSVDVQNKNKINNKKLPPINTFHQNSNDLVKLFKDCGEIKEFEIKKINKAKTQIKVKNLEDFRSAKEMLKRVEAPFFSYTPKEEKQQTFLLKGLCEGCDPEKLLRELRAMVPEVNITSVRPFTTRRSILEKRVLPIYIIQISHDSVPAELLKLRYLNHQVVRLEKLIKKDTMQCYRCQRFGHSSANCNMQFRCVKCEATHEPGNCALLADEGKEKTFCVNCRSYGHPASFKGCPAYMNTQTKFNKINKNMVTAREPVIASAPVTPGVSFAEVARGRTAPQPKSNENELMSMFKIILDRLGKIENTLVDHGSKIRVLMGAINSPNGQY